MDSGTVLIILFVLGVIFIASGIFITISTNTQNVETLEEANARLHEMRKKYEEKRPTDERTD